MNHQTKISNIRTSTRTREVTLLTDPGVYPQLTLTLDADAAEQLGWLLIEGAWRARGEAT